MAQRRLKNKAPTVEELLALAHERVELPSDHWSVRYEADADLLYIAFTERPNPTHSDDDLEKGIVYDYEGEKLVAVEILDLYGVFVN